jgi:hypothetical protein
MHSDHRRGVEYRQEYGGNERENLLSLQSAMAREAQKGGGGRD